MRSLRGRPLGVRVDLPPGVPIGLPAAMPLAARPAGVVRAVLRSGASGPAPAQVRRASGGCRAVLAAAMAARWRVAGAGGDLLVPVPVHAERARRRGYDQAVLLAADVSRAAGAALAGALERTRNTAPQFDLGRRARRSNVAGAFALRSGDGRALVEGRWIVLVDDVVTTGSTLVACAEALYAAGAVAVSALTVARER